MPGAKALITAVTAVASLAWLALGPQPAPLATQPPRLAAQAAELAAQPATPAPALPSSVAEAAAPAPESGARPEPPHPPISPPAAPERFRAAFATSRGDFTIEVVRAWAPHGADQFHRLVVAGFFDDSRFFRVVPGFIAQFGVAGDPRTTAAWRGRTIPDDPVRQSNVRGTIAFAMTGPGTRSTQLYINLSDNVRLDAQGFAPIGRVAEGMDTVDHLYGGYGETAGGGMRGGRQAAILEGGNAHLDANFPQLDRLLRARLIEERP